MVCFCQIYLAQLTISLHDLADPLVFSMKNTDIQVMVHNSSVLRFIKKKRIV